MTLKHRWCLAALAGALLLPTGYAAAAPAAPAVNHPLFNRRHPKETAGSAVPFPNAIIGNKRSHVYHPPGAKGALPAPKNRVYFHSVAEARAAGYHPAKQRGTAAVHHPAKSAHPRAH